MVVKHCRSLPARCHNHRSRRDPGALSARPGWCCLVLDELPGQAAVRSPETAGEMAGIGESACLPSPSPTRTPPSTPSPRGQL